MDETLFEGLRVRGSHSSTLVGRKLLAAGDGVVTRMTWSGTHIGSWAALSQS
jgi:hypothetical protein